METGIDLINEERKEQIDKHGFTSAHDKKSNSNGQLAEAAVFAITKDPYHFPENWDESWYNKLSNKKGIEALKIAGALIAAEIDRLNG